MRRLAAVGLLVLAIQALGAQEVTLKLGPPVPKRPALFGVRAGDTDVAALLTRLRLVPSALDTTPRLVEARGPQPVDLAALPERLWPSTMIAYGAGLAQHEAAAGSPFRLVYGLKPVTGKAPAERYLREAVGLPVHSLYAAGVVLGALSVPQAQSALLDTFAASARNELGDLHADATAQVLSHFATLVAQAESIHLVDVSGGPRLPIGLFGKTLVPALSAVALVSPARVVYVILNASDQPVPSLLPLDPEWVKVRRVVYRGGPLEVAGTQTVPGALLLNMPWQGPLLAQEDGYCCATGETVPLEISPYSLSFDFMEK